MSLNGIQKDVDEWVGKHKTKYWHPLANLGHLMEEEGELAREVLHRCGEKIKKPDEPEGNLGQELVDIIFTLTCLANSYEIDLSKEWKIMFKDKLNGRDKDRFQKK